MNMTKVFNETGARLYAKKQSFVLKVQSFFRDETSAGKGTTEEGFLLYAGLIVGILVLGIVAVALRGGATSIMQRFTEVTNRGTDGW